MDRVLLSLTLGAALFAAGCYESFVLPSGVSPRDAGTPRVVDAGPLSRLDSGPRLRRDAGPRPVDAGPPVDSRPPRSVDLLLVVDDSSSMSEEQASLAAELPRLINILMSGDFDQDGRPDGPADFRPIPSLHIGVITPDMGVGGNRVPTCEAADFGDDGVLRDRGGEGGCRRPGPAFLAFGAAPSTDLLAEASCRVLQGGGGCGFEQPLEAALKALSPSARIPGTAPGYEAPRFFRDTTGHGDGANAGFLGASSVLAVTLFTDEDDCSASDPELFDLGSSTYRDTPPNVRCIVHGDEALHPIGRFVRGLAQLRESVGQLVYVPIAGVPVDLVPPAGGAIDWDRLISEDADERDPRMIERIDPENPDRLIPSCNIPGRGVAFPPVRILRTARELRTLGAHVGVTSICQDSFLSVIEPILEAVER